MSTFNHLFYPLVIETTENNELGMYFHDFEGTAILPSDINDGIRKAKELLNYRIIELIEANSELPSPTELSDIQVMNPNDRVIYVDVYLPVINNELSNKAVTKNCTLPRWLRDAGEDAGLNFSQLLQVAIKDALGIKYKK